MPQASAVMERMLDCDTCNDHGITNSDYRKE